MLISRRYELISIDRTKKFDDFQIRTLIAYAQLKKERKSPNTALKPSQPKTL